MWRRASCDFIFTLWSRVTHICVSKLTIIGLDNGLSSGRRQAIIWTNAGILFIWPLNFSGILIEIHTFSFQKMHLKMSSGNRRPFCLGLNVLMTSSWSTISTPNLSAPASMMALIAPGYKEAISIISIIRWRFEGVRAFRLQILWEKAKTSNIFVFDRKNGNFYGMLSVTSLRGSSTTQ